MFEFLVRRPVTVSCLLLMVVCLSLYGITRLEFGGGLTGARSGFEVIIEHFGIDSEEMERSVTKPVEEALGGLGGIAEMRSVSEYGSSRLNIECLPGVQAADFYLDLRELVDRAYAQMPSSVQKPRIHASDSRNAPVFIVSLETSAMGQSEFHDWVEKSLKPEFESLRGVGEVEVGGGNQREIHIRLDLPVAIGRGQSAPGVAKVLRAQDNLLPAGRLVEGGSFSTVVVDGHFGNVRELENLRFADPDKGSAFRLADFASVEYGEQEAQRISRLDGQHKLLLYIHPAGAANPIALSQSLRAKTQELSEKGLHPQIVLDSGKEMQDALTRTIWAMVEGLAVVIFTLPLFLPRLGQLIGMAVMIPLSLLISLAVFAACGIPVDPYILAGIAIGLGSILDTCILVAEQASVWTLRRLVPALLSSLLTVLAVLIPLLALSSLEFSLRNMALAIIIILAVTFVCSLVFIPGLAKIPLTAASATGDQHAFSGPIGQFRAWVSQRYGRKSRRAFCRVVLAVSRRPVPVLALSLAICVGAAILASTQGFALEQSGDSRAIMAHIEFPPQLNLATIDARMGELSRLVGKVGGIERVESLSRQGSAEMTVMCGETSKTRAELIRGIQECGRLIPEAFVYIPNGGTKELSVELAISGDDNEKLRALAQEAAKILQEQSWVSQVVLNFKEAPRELALTIDRQRALTAGLSIAEITSTLRWNLWGPVALKWLDRDRERDLRIMDRNAKSLNREQLLRLPAGSTPGNTVSLGSLVHLSEAPGSPKIYHLNRQRVVYLTLHSQALSLEKIQTGIRKALSGLQLPRAYAITVDRHLRESEESTNRLAWFLVASLVFIVIVLVFQSQSIGAALLVLSIVPLSLAVPVLANALGGGGLTIPIILGCIILAGVVVNNSILVVDGVLQSGKGKFQGWSGAGLAYRAVRSRIGPLSITAIATLIGCFPLLFASAGPNGFMAALSLVIFWGAFGGLAATVITLPALIACWPQALRSYTNSSSLEASL